MSRRQLCCMPHERANVLGQLLCQSMYQAPGDSIESALYIAWTPSQPELNSNIEEEPLYLVLKGLEADH